MKSRYVSENGQNKDTLTVVAEITGSYDAFFTSSGREIRIYKTKSRFPESDKESNAYHKMLVAVRNYVETVRDEISKNVTADLELKVFENDD